MKKVLVNFIQDRSGSMASCWDETLNGFKKFVEDLRDNSEKDQVEYLFSLTTFDTLVETPIIAQSIKNVDPGELQKHGPRGMTALYDAVGATIENTSADRHGAEKVICVIVTDGQENSSREWSKDRLHAAIESKLKAGDWTFTYLGTQPETWDDAGRLGVQVGAVASYTPTMASAAYGVTSSAVRSLSKSASLGSRALMHDFVERSVACSAGMDIRDNGTVAVPSATTSPKTNSTVRPTTTTAKNRTQRWR